MHEIDPIFYVLVWFCYSHPESCSLNSTTNSEVDSSEFSQFITISLFLMKKQWQIVELVKNLWNLDLQFGNWLLDPLIKTQKQINPFVFAFSLFLNTRWFNLWFIWSTKYKLFWLVHFGPLLSSTVSFGSDLSHIMEMLSCSMY